MSFLKTLILHKAWLFFPGHEGKVSGAVYAGFGLGGFLGITLSTHWANPDGVHSNEINKDDASSKPFDKDIAENMPIMLRKLCIVWAVYVGISILLYRHPYHHDSNKKLGEIKLNEETNGDSEV